LTKEKADLIASRDGLTKEKATLTTARDAEAKAKTEATQLCAALTKEKADLIASRDGLTKEKATLTTARDAEAKAKAEVIQQRDSAAQQQAKALQEQQQESELLLLQLHQVQEELEHYFLQHQQATQDKAQLDTRWSKLMARYPDYTEWDRVELVQDDIQTTKPSQVRTQIHGLKSGGRSLPMLDLTVKVTNKRPILILTPPARASESPLLYWPIRVNEAGANALQPLTIDPSAAFATQASELLRSLTPSDINALCSACSAMLDGLPTTLPQRSSWVQHVSTLRQQLVDLSPVWRFDAVQLKHQQVNPDYENLCFTLTNAHFGARRWPSFEFRLSASNIKRGKFSGHPKLEFPLQEQGDKQFENWFEESEDDQGPKFELRFDIKTRSLDINTWRTLSASDQAQTLSLSDQLPVLLQRLQAQGVQISRPWIDWQGMAGAIQDAFSHCLSAPTRQQPSA
jgi:hypothetical protein